MNILWTYAADIKKIVSGLREMIESRHLSLRWQFSSQMAWFLLARLLENLPKNIKCQIFDWWVTKVLKKSFILITPRHDSYAYIILSTVIIQLVEIVVGNKGVNRKPIERCVMVIVK